MAMYLNQSVAIAMAFFSLDVLRASEGPLRDGWNRRQSPWQRRTKYRGGTTKGTIAQRKAKRQRRRDSR